jgi:glycosyltransferase involved in cell wall biosynthesis
MTHSIARARHLGRRLVRAAGELRRPPEVSQQNLRRFLAEMEGRPRVELPQQPPGTIAILVPCYRHAAYLPETLQSIASQTRLPDEVIFVDDGSPDESAAIVERFIETHPWLSNGRGRLLVNARNVGQAASLNRAIDEARSDLVMILNDDDYLMHDAIESMLRLFARHPDVALIGAHSIHFESGEGLASAPKLSTAYAPADLPLTVQQPQQARRYRRYNDLNMTHSGSCFVRVAAQAIGGYREKSARCVPFSDRDFQIRMNLMWPAAVAYETPYSMWRADSSVDRGVES